MASDLSHGGPQQELARRDFMVVASGSFAAVGAALALWPFIDSLNPSTDVRAFSTLEVDLKPIQPGQRITARWRGRPLFVAHRTAQEIERVRADDIQSSGRATVVAINGLVLEPTRLPRIVSTDTALGCPDFAEFPA